MRGEIEGGSRFGGERRGEGDVRLRGCDRDIKEGEEEKTGTGRGRRIGRL